MGVMQAGDTAEAIDLTWSTEQRNPRTVDIDIQPAEALVDMILTEDEAVVPAVRAQGKHVAALVDAGVAALRAGGRIHYVGSGTSGRLGVLDAVELLPTYSVDDNMVVAHIAGGLDAMLRAQEGAEDDVEAGIATVADAGEHDLIVGIAASGRTPYVRGALAEARRRGLTTALVSSNPAAPLAELADIAILVDSGPEVVTGSTRMKAATAQKLVLNTFSTGVMIRLGKTYSNLMIDVIPTNEKLRRRTVRILEQAAGCTSEEASAALAAGGALRTALVMLLAGVDAATAEAALADPSVAEVHDDDPAGIRTAVELATR